MNRHLLIWCVCVFGMIATAAFAGGPIGELGLGGGAIFPQGNYAKYADPGPHFSIRLNTHISHFEAVSGWFDLGGAIFTDDNESIFLIVENIAVPAKKEMTEYMISFHAGLQFGSDSRKGFFRPRATFAPGLYLFNTETGIRPLDYTEDLVTINDTRVRFGWRGVLGADFFFSPKWGISLDFYYDQVINLQRVIGTNENNKPIEVSQSARFHSFMIGVVIPFETMEDGNEEPQ